MLKSPRLWVSCQIPLGCASPSLLSYMLSSSVWRNDKSHAYRYYHLQLCEWDLSNNVSTNKWSYQTDARSKKDRSRFATSTLGMEYAQVTADVSMAVLEVSVLVASRKNPVKYRGIVRTQYARLCCQYFDTPGSPFSRFQSVPCLLKGSNIVIQYVLRPTNTRKSFLDHLSILRGEPWNWAAYAR